MIRTDPGSRSLGSDPGIHFRDPRTCLLTTRPDRERPASQPPPTESDLPHDRPDRERPASRPPPTETDLPPEKTRPRETCLTTAPTERDLPPDQTRPRETCLTTAPDRERPASRPDPTERDLPHDRPRPRETCLPTRPDRERPASRPPPTERDLPHDLTGSTAAQVESADRPRGAVVRESGTHILTHRHKSVSLLVRCAVCRYWFDGRQ